MLINKLNTKSRKFHEFYKSFCSKKLAFYFRNFREKIVHQQKCY